MGKSHEFRGLAHEGKWYRLRRWALDYRRFHGDPGNQALWEELAAFMETPRHRTRPGQCCAPWWSASIQRRPLHGNRWPNS